MSLQVWLPLNGNLNNQGLGEVTVTNNGATVDSNGKIGSCYSFDGDDDFISLTSSSLYSTIKGGSLPFSITMWVYRADTTRAILFGDYHLADSINFNLELSTSNTVRFYWGADPDLVFDNTVVTTSKWSHLALTYDGSIIKCYINGILTQSSTITLSSKNKTSGSYYLGRDARTGTTAFNGKMNDFRLYDHCLSAKEVKEISKGLICHYKLDNGFGNPNIFSNSHFDSRYTVSNWDTSKNGNLCANSWGGYNSGVGNPSTVYHAHLQEHEGDYVYNYHKTSDEDWLGISQAITGRVEVSKTYTFSCELKRISGKNYADGGLYTRANSSATSNTFVNWFSFSNFGSVTDNKWHRYSYTFTVDSSVYMTNGAYWYIYGHTGGDGEFLMRRPKLEEGSSATEWIPHSSDSLYTSLGLDSATEVDCSGLGNNGVIRNQSSISIERDSPRYDASTVFNGTPFIIGQNLNGAKSTDALSLCAWVNPSQVSGEYYIVDSYESGGAGLHISSGDIYFQIYSSGYTQVSGGSVSTNTWYHIVGTYDNSKLRIYVNGELKGEVSKTGNITYNSSTPWAVAVNPSGTSGGDGGYFYGKLSDVRIYSTALSASDIKELYNTSASIDKNGNMYAYEFKEE